MPGTHWATGLLQSWSLLYMLGRLLAKGVPTIVFYAAGARRVYVFRARGAKVTVQAFHA